MDTYRRLRVEEEAAAKTIYGETVIIRQLVNFALPRDELSAAPLKGIKIKKPKPTQQPCWSFEQVQNILAASPESIRPALKLLASTGKRFGEMAWLRWEDVDFGKKLCGSDPRTAGSGRPAMSEPYQLRRSWGVCWIRCRGPTAGW